MIFANGANHSLTNSSLGLNDLIILFSTIIDMQLLSYFTVVQRVVANGYLDDEDDDENDKNEELSVVKVRSLLKLFIKYLNTLKKMRYRRFVEQLPIPRLSSDVINYRASFLCGVRLRMVSNLPHSPKLILTFLQKYVERENVSFCALCDSLKAHLGCMFKDGAVDVSLAAPSRSMGFMADGYQNEKKRISKFTRYESSKISLWLKDCIFQFTVQAVA
jgi:hypothetical protein